MAFDLNAPRPAVIPEIQTIAGPVTLTYDAAKFKGAWLDELSTKTIPETLVELILAWDITANGTPIAPTVELFKQFEPRVVRALYDAIWQDYTGGN